VNRRLRPPPLGGGMAEAKPPPPLAGPESPCPLQTRRSPARWPWLKAADSLRAPGYERERRLQRRERPDVTGCPVVDKLGNDCGVRWRFPNRPGDIRRTIIQTADLRIEMRALRIWSNAEERDRWAGPCQRCQQRWPKSPVHLPSHMRMVSTGPDQRYRPTGNAPGGGEGARERARPPRRHGLCTTPWCARPRTWYTLEMRIRPADRRSRSNFGSVDNDPPAAMRYRPNHGCRHSPPTSLPKTSKLKPSISFDNFRRFPSRSRPMIAGAAAPPCC